MNLYRALILRPGLSCLAKLVFLSALLHQMVINTFLQLGIVGAVVIVINLPNCNVPNMDLPCIMYLRYTSLIVNSRGRLYIHRVLITDVSRFSIKTLDQRNHITAYLVKYPATGFCAKTCAVQTFATLTFLQGEQAV